MALTAFPYFNSITGLFSPPKLHLLLAMSQDSHELWARCLVKIERHLHHRPASFDTWFRPTRVQCFDEESLVIEVSSSYFADWVESHYLPLIQSVVEEETHRTPKITFTVVEEESAAPLSTGTQETKTASFPPPTPIPSRTAPPQKSPPVSQHTEEWAGSGLFTPLNERYTFEAFIIGQDNRMAHAAAQAVAESPGRPQFNPLVLYGGVGLGKTHLVQAIGHYALAHKTAQRVAYVPSERFLSNFIEAIRNGSTAEFQRLYRSADILLVDDIQFLLRGEKTQDEFFHTFNSLHQNGKQIAMTCDSPPEELEGLQDRLISRFQWGLVTTIDPPDLETRIAILHQKAEINGIHLTEEVATFLGNYISSNVRELEGALNHLMAHCAVHREEMNLEAARKIVQKRLPSQVSHLSIEAIQQTVAEHFGLHPEVLIGRTRTQEVATARQIAMYLAKRLTHNPLTSIGMHFGRRDHSTVIHAVQSIERKIKQDSSLSHLIDALSDSIQQRYSPP